jgi:hypothetical protein
VAAILRQMADVEARSAASGEGDPGTVEGISEEGDEAPGEAATGGAETVVGVGLRRRRRRRVWLVSAAGGMFAAAAGVAIAATTGVRLPGEAATGSVALGSPQAVRRQLDQAELLDTEGQSAEALRLFHQVLAADPGQPEALAESGWIEFGAGVRSAQASVVEQGQQDEIAAVRAAPGSWAPRLYLGSMELDEGDPGDAATQFGAFLADDPPTATVREAAGAITLAYQRAGRPVPSLPPGSPTAPAGAPTG